MDTNDSTKSNIEVIESNFFITTYDSLVALVEQMSTAELATSVIFSILGCYAVFKLIYDTFFRSKKEA